MRAQISGTNTQALVTVSGRNGTGKSLVLEAIGYPDLVIWPSRTLENELLDPDLLAKTLERAGETVTADRCRDTLKAIADGHRSEILADLIEAALRRRHATRPTGSTRIARLKSFIAEQRRVAGAKLAEFDEVASAVEDDLTSRWDRDWAVLMDGKRALGEFVRETPFRSVATLIGAETATLRDHPELMPSGLATLRERIRQLALTTVGG
jgi:lambda repressor-like predicted transcriptional regulator